MDNGCPQCMKLPRSVMCPECELDYLDACISRDMARIEVLKQIIAKGEKHADNRRLEKVKIPYTEGR